MTDPIQTLARLSLIPDAFTGADLNEITEARAIYDNGSYETETDRLANMTVALLTDALIAVDKAHKRSTVRRGLPEPLWTTLEVRNHREAVHHANALVDGVRVALEARRAMQAALPVIYEDRFDWTLATTDPQPGPDIVDIADIADAVFTEGPSHANGPYETPRSGKPTEYVNRHRGSLVSFKA